MEASFLLACIVLEGDLQDVGEEKLLTVLPNCEHC